MASIDLIKLATLLFVACCHLVSTDAASLKAMEGDGGIGMAEEELLGLYDVVGALLEDPNWAQLHPHPCTDTPWPGIQCDTVQGQEQLQDPVLHVTKLHIGPDIASPPCKAAAELSPSLLKLPFLKTLSLFNCFLTAGAASLAPSLFTNASSLQQLVIKTNPGLTGEIPPTIANLGSLRVLSLSQNSLRGEIPKEIGGLGRLEQLDLSYNNLSGKIPVEIGGLTSLTIFDLSYNGLEGEIPWSVGQLQSLQKMDLSSNLLSGRILPSIGKLERLVLLDLSHNSLTGPVPGTFSELRELQYLLIENNPIGTSIPLFVATLTKLVVLGLSGCGLSGPIPTNFGSLCNLTALFLDRNRLDGSVPPSLGEIAKLGHLNLSQNQLSGEIAFSEEFVRRLGKRLDVRDNKGLCVNTQGHLSLPSYLEAPPCLDSSEASYRSWAEGPGVEPNALRVSSTWSAGKSWLGSLGFEMFIIIWCLVLLCKFDGF